MDFKYLLIFACIILQILDGAFTGYGAINSSLGVDVEGNPFIKLMMINFGIIPALVVVKSCAIYAIYFLKRQNTPTWCFAVIFGIYFPIILLWCKVIFVDKLIF